MSKRTRRPNRPVVKPRGAVNPAPPVEAEDPLDAVVARLDQERRAIAARDEAVLRARASGVTWTALARVLGVTPQAVQQRYAPRVVQRS